MGNKLNSNLIYSGDNEKRNDNNVYIYHDEFSTIIADCPEDIKGKDVTKIVPIDNIKEDRLNFSNGKITTGVSEAELITNRKYEIIYLKDKLKIFEEQKKEFKINDAQLTELKEFIYSLSKDKEIPDYPLLLKILLEYFGDESV